MRWGELKRRVNSVSNKAIVELAYCTIEEIPSCSYSFMLYVCHIMSSYGTSARRRDLPV